MNTHNHHTELLIPFLSFISFFLSDVASSGVISLAYLCDHFYKINSKGQLRHATTGKCSLSIRLSAWRLFRPNLMVPWHLGCQGASLTSSKLRFNCLYYQPFQYHKHMFRFWIESCWYKIQRDITLSTVMAIRDPWPVAPLVLISSWIHNEP